MTAAMTLRNFGRIQHICIGTLFLSYVRVVHGLSIHPENDWPRGKYAWKRMNAHPVVRKLEISRFLHVVFAPTMAHGKRGPTTLTSSRII
eukprot:scaffold5540_cov96-Cylindrotheca_fusiformis.AAC.7